MHDPVDPQDGDIERAAIRAESSANGKVLPIDGARAKPQPVMRLLGPDEIFAPLPPIEYAIGGLLPRASLMLLGGYGSSAKTWLALDMLCAVGAGDRWLGILPCEAGRALFVDYESGERELRRRIQLLAAGRALSRIDGIAIAPMPSAYLGHHKLERELYRCAEVCRLIVLDSLRAASPAADENDSSFRTGLDTLKRIAEHTGCSFCVLVHSKKAGAPSKAGGDADPRESLRGSSAIFDAADVILVSNVNRADECLEIAQTKARSGKPCFAEPARVRILDTAADPLRDVPAGVVLGSLDADAQQTLVPPARESFEARCSRVLAAIRRKPDMGTTGLRQEIGGKAANVDGALEYLLNRKVVVDLGENGRHRYRIFDAPPSGDAQVAHSEETNA